MFPKNHINNDLEFTPTLETQQSLMGLEPYLWHQVGRNVDSVYLKTGV